MATRQCFARHRRMSHRQVDCRSRRERSGCRATCPRPCRASSTTTGPRPDAHRVTGTPRSARPSTSAVPRVRIRLRLPTVRL